MATAQEPWLVALEVEVTRLTSGGWRIEERNEGSVTLTRGQKVNHVLHLLLFIVTLGVWGIVWACLITFGGKRTIRLHVDWTKIVGQERA
ncbi:MAG: hypothetical protein OXF78_01555 [Rhodospirillales bacterium]|nr:hypothetical protein [Rhodospirillales bacterium]